MELAEWVAADVFARACVFCDRSNSSLHSKCCCFPTRLTNQECFPSLRYRDALLATVLPHPSLSLPLNQKKKKKTTECLSARQGCPEIPRAPPNFKNFSWRRPDHSSRLMELPNFLYSFVLSSAMLPFSISFSDSSSSISFLTSAEAVSSMLSASGKSHTTADANRRKKIRKKT